MGHDPDTRPWWQEGVIYQIYPRSFADSNGDGIGDLRGIVSRLDYLKDLGVDGIWLSPINPSPMFDFGYDVSDYRGIAPEFGTLDDFRLLLREAEARGIRVVLDLVLNHSSHLHPWFLESRASRDSDKRDWYVWHEGRNGGPPNNWLAAFGGPAWEWDEATRQFYLHSFLPQQPDLNWRSPRVKQAAEDVVAWWLDMGVAGFRLDVVNWFLKDALLRDNPVKLFGRRPYDRQKHVYDRNRPETIDLVRWLRASVDRWPDRMLVGEVYNEPPGNPELSASYYACGEGLHLAFDFSLLFCRWSAAELASAIDAWEAALPHPGWPTWTLGNHDQHRVLSRYASGANREARGRVAAALVLTLRGTPFLYYGEEIGMLDVKIPRSRLQDPLGKAYWPLPVGRDPARTPMQWSAEPHAGFSSVEPWLPVHREHVEINAARAEADPGSLLHWYRGLIRLRRDEPVLRRGTYRRLEQGAGVLGFVREHDGDRIAVLLNFESRPRQAILPTGATWRVLAASARRPGDRIVGGVLDLDADGVLIAKAGAPQARTLGSARGARSAAAR
ncbi:MAG: alpha-amylase family glycosyl hydrolase [Thermodesulfobacteriota bacterium]